MKEALSYAGTVDRLVTAIKNNPQAYESCVRTARGMKAVSKEYLPRHFAEQFLVFDADYGDEIMSAYDWLITTKAHLASAWGQVIHDYLKDN